MAVIGIRAAKLEDGPLDKTVSSDPVGLLDPAAATEGPDAFRGASCPRASQEF